MNIVGDVIYQLFDHSWIIGLIVFHFLMDNLVSSLACRSQTDRDRQRRRAAGRDKERKARRDKDTKKDRKKARKIKEMAKKAKRTEDPKRKLD